MSANGSPLLMGIDVGTTRVKVGVFQLDGQQAALAASNYAHGMHTEGEAAEQDATEWCTHLYKAISTVIEQIDSRMLLAVCVGGQGPTMVASDDSLVPVAPALTWMDRRPATQAQVLSQRVGRSVPPHSFLAKAMWLAQTNPAAYEQAHWFMQAWDYVASQLTGTALVSTSAATAPWDAELVSASGLDAEKFPPTQLMGTRLGSVAASAAQLTGLPEGLPVIGGISDYFGGILGSGAVCRGIACDSGGTSSSFNVCWDQRLKVKGIFCLPSFDGHSYYIGGPTSSSGRALEWWREIIGASSTDWTMLGAAADVEPGSSRLIFLPYLAGERAPLWDATARGVWFGLSLNHARAHMTRSILEAVAYSLQHIASHIEQAGAEIDEIHCCGGQAASELWCQIKADVTGRRVVIPQVLEAAVLGSAVIAGVGAGVFEDFTRGSLQMMRPHRVLEPNPENHAVYREMYSLYRDLYERVKPLNG